MEDLETVLNALYQAQEKDLLMKLKTDAQNMIWAISEGNEHLTHHISCWSDQENNLLMEEKIPQLFSDFDLKTVRELFALRVFNRNAENDIDTIFGCLTTGEIWHFVKLEKDMITIDQRPYYLVELPKILGIFQEVIDFYKIKEKKEA